MVVCLQLPWSTRVHHTSHISWVKPIKTNNFGIYLTLNYCLDLVCLVCLILSIGSDYYRLPRLNRLFCVFYSVVLQSCLHSMKLGGPCSLVETEGCLSKISQSCRRSQRDISRVVRTEQRKKLQLPLLHSSSSSKHWFDVSGGQAWTGIFFGWHYLTVGEHISRQIGIINTETNGEKKTGTFCFSKTITRIS